MSAGDMGRVWTLLRDNPDVTLEVAVGRLAKGSYNNQHQENTRDSFSSSSSSTTRQTANRAASRPGTWNETQTALKGQGMSAEDMGRVWALLRDNPDVITLQQAISRVQRGKDAATKDEQGSQPTYNDERSDRSPRQGPQSNFRSEQSDDDSCSTNGSKPSLTRSYSQTSETTNGLGRKFAEYLHSREISKVSRRLKRNVLQNMSF